MRQIQQLVYILLYLQFFHNVFTFDVNILSKQNVSDTSDIMWINEWKCNSNDECTVVNSTCNNYLCQCAPGYIFNADMTSCIKVATGLHDPCEETVQCSAYLLSGARCINKVCVCGPGYYYLHGRCNRYVGLSEKCEQNIDCYVNAEFESSTCDTVKRICKCSSGFYQREYRTCRRKGKKINDECTIDMDCIFSNATCNNFVCARKSESDEAIELSSDAVLINRDTVKQNIRVGSNCTTDEQCRVLGNATCGPTGTCRCDRAYFAPDTNTTCIPELGESCQNGEDGYIKKSICRDRIWSCTSGTVASEDNRECRQATTKYEGDCRHHEQCYIFGPDATCSNNKCICNESVSRYLESELFCWGNKGPNEICIQDRDCYVKDFKGKLICNNICECSDGTHLNKNNTGCIGDAGLGGVCEIDDDCAMPNSICEEEVCSCAENYYQSDEQCLAGINSTCTQDDDCKPPFSRCISNNCSCRSDHVPVATDSCMPLLSYGEPCSLDIQCSINTAGAICAAKDATNVTESPTVEEDKVCTCSEGDYYKYGQCLKKKFLGETCANLGECYESFNQNRIVCKNGECTCDKGYKKLNNSICENGTINNVISTGLFSIVLLYLLVNYFRFVKEMC